MKIYIIGIGGNGMIGVAKWALDSGFEVSGSDLNLSNRIISLREMGVNINLNHNKFNVIGFNIVIYSIGIPGSNPELQYAKSTCIPTFTRMQAIGLLSNRLNKQLISIIGTCGKSSISSMLSSVFLNFWPDTSIYVGAETKNSSSFQLSSGKYSIVESCEYKGEFYHLSPNYCLLSNIAINHEDFFGTEIKTLVESFKSFIAFNLKENGLLVACIDTDVVEEKILYNYKGTTITYSLNNESANCYCIYTKIVKNGTSFKVNYFNKIYDFYLPCFGMHAIQNALGVISLSLSLGVPVENIRKGLGNFSGLKRRFETIFKSKKMTIIDDNARIPEQIKATVCTLINTYPNRKIIVIGGFWGKLNSRNLTKIKDALYGVNYVYLLPVGSCGQKFMGAEKDNADILLSTMLNEEGIKSVIDNKCSLDDLNLFIENNNVVICRMGYDSYVSKFDELCGKLVRQ